MTQELDAKGPTEHPAVIRVDHTEVGPLYYVRFNNRADPPYREQRHVNAILDIAADGSLAGIELIDNMPEPPTPAKTDIGGLVEMADAVRRVADSRSAILGRQQSECLNKAADALSASEARIAELERDMDTLEYLHSERDRGEKLVDEKLAAAEARIAGLTKALEPFARAGDIFECRSAGRPINDDDPVYDWEDHRVGARRITVGNFRAARKTLEGGK